MKLASVPSQGFALLVAMAFSFHPATCFVPTVDPKQNRLCTFRPLAEAPDGSKKEGEGSDDDETTSPVEFSSDAVIKVDDGGSDLTDRFKYKVRHTCTLWLKAKGIQFKRNYDVPLLTLHNFCLFCCTGQCADGSL